MNATLTLTDNTSYEMTVYTAKEYYFLPERPEACVKIRGVYYPIVDFTANMDQTVFSATVQYGSGLKDEIDVTDRDILVEE